MSLEAQKWLFAFALDLLGDQEPINELLAVTLDEHKVVHVEAIIFRRPSEDWGSFRSPSFPPTLASCIEEPRPAGDGYPIWIP